MRLHRAVEGNSKKNVILTMSPQHAPVMTLDAELISILFIS